MICAYDRIRDATSKCAQTLTQVSLIYRTEPTTKKREKEELKSKNGYAQVSVTVQGIHKVSPEEKEGYGGKNLQKRQQCGLTSNYFDHSLATVIMWHQLFTSVQYPVTKWFCVYPTTETDVYYAHNAHAGYCNMAHHAAMFFTVKNANCLHRHGSYDLSGTIQICLLLLLL